MDDTPAKEPRHRLWAEIDLDAILHNYRVIKQHVGAGVRMTAMVKSNAYGHGVVQVAGVLQKGGADCFGVANVDEAIELREAGIRKPILITGPITECEIPEALRYDVEITATPPEVIDLIEEEARRRVKAARVHLLLDTGMTRSGMPWDLAIESAARMKASPAFNCVGVFTHFPKAEDAGYSREQLNVFDGMCRRLGELGLLPPIRHTANTMGIFNVENSHYEMVRPGIGLYGMYPDQAMRQVVTLRPAMTVRTQIVYVRDVPAGTGIGYGHSYKTYRQTKIATLPIGYADGFQRSLSNRGGVIVAGKYAPVVGTISMDMLTIDVGHVPGVHVGMPVTIIGSEGEAEITAEEHALHRGTIPYEVTCLIGKRVKRIFIAKENRQPATRPLVA